MPRLLDHPKPLGRRTAIDQGHVNRWPYSLVAPRTVDHVEFTLKLPYWHWSHDQGREGSCVGHGSAMERAIAWRRKGILRNLPIITARFDPIDIWHQARLVDEWTDNDDLSDNDQGTSVRAGYDILRSIGPRRVRKMELDPNGLPTPVGEKDRDVSDGVSVTRWATSVDEIRTAIADRMAVVIGITWYSAFDNPVTFNGEQWVVSPGVASLGWVRGGHCVCLYGASDKRQAFRLKNSWGRSYPLAWLPYNVMERLLSEDGEAALISDR